MDSLDEARKAHRLRLGAGARWDAPKAPAIELDWARRGTAYFARLLNEQTDNELDSASLVPGWTRRHVIAQVCYQARALTRLTSAADRQEGSMYESEDARLQEVEVGATLPSHALRGLYHHAAVHLDVEWRDLSDAAWDARIKLPGGHGIELRETPFLRARELWLRAEDLHGKGSLIDSPPSFLDRLVDDACRAWSGPPAVLVLEDRGRKSLMLGKGDGPLVAGKIADLARWLSGRGARRLTHETPLPAIAGPAR